jgi:hypothetical protein
MRPRARSDLGAFHSLSTIHRLAARGEGAGAMGRGARGGAAVVLIAPRSELPHKQTSD